MTTLITPPIATVPTPSIATIPVPPKPKSKFKQFLDLLFKKRTTYYAVLLFDGFQHYIAGTPFPSIDEAKVFIRKVNNDNKSIHFVGIVSFRSRKTLVRIENRFDLVGKKKNPKVNA